MLLFDRLFTPSCVACSLAPGPVCADCEADFFPIERRRCQVCAISLHGADDVCGRCLAAPPNFHLATALADYASPVDAMVMALKFRARFDIASAFGRLLARRVPLPNEALVVPVPLAFERMSERGFNQSMQIARAFCRSSGAQLATGLVRRVRHSPPQQTLALAERRRNIRGAFEITGDVRGRQILVVDDVMTSGSTMDELARLLVAAGATRIHALVVARTA